MRTLKNQNDALLDAIVMLRVIELGGTYSSMEWHERLIRLESMVAEDSRAEIKTRLDSALNARYRKERN